MRKVQNPVDTIEIITISFIVKPMKGGRPARERKNRRKYSFIGFGA